MKKIIFTLSTLLLLAFVTLQAQEVTVTASAAAGEPGETVSVDITVQGWTDVAGAQWSMHWDDSVLEFSSVSDYALEDETDGSFGMPPVTEMNTLTFTWFDLSLNGVTLADGALLFRVNFNAIGSIGSASDFTFDGMPTAVEVLNPESEVYDVIFEESTVDVGSSFTEIVQTKDFALYANSPNPFKNTTNIIFDLHEKADATLTVFTAAGQVLFEQNYDLPAGSHSLPLSGDIFPAAGTYMYRLTTDSAVAARKLTVIE